MTRRQKRTTRTITFEGGPRDGTTEQAPLESDGVLDATATPYAFHRYAGPAGGGAAVFTYEGIVDPDGNPTTEEAADALFRSEMLAAVDAAQDTDASSGEDTIGDTLRFEAEARAREAFGGGRS